MAKSKAQQNSMALDPQRQMIAKNMSVMPGGPQNNNPMNVTDNASPAIQSKSIYGDYDQNYAQMGTGMVNPMGVVLRDFNKICLWVEARMLKLLMECSSSLTLVRLFLQQT